MRAEFYLSQSAYVSVLETAGVFLSTATDRYYLVQKDQFVWLNDLLGSPSHQLSHPARAFADQLIALGLLTRDAGAGKPFAPTVRPAATAALPEERPPETARVHLAETFRFFRAAALARKVRTRLRLEPLLETARRWSTLPEDERSPTPSELAALVSRFKALEPLAYSVQDACLFRSLVLLRYLTFSGIAPDWVFGVRLRPFGAHCWVEKDGVVLNDALETVQAYCPIMCV